MSLQAFWGRRLFRWWASFLVMIGKRFANQPGQLVPARVGYVGQHGVAARAAAGQLWTLRPRRLRSCRSMQQLQSRRAPSAALSLKHPSSVPAGPIFFLQGFIFAQKIASFAQNLCFPMLPCLQMFFPFCINLRREGFAGNWREAPSFSRWLSSSTLQAG